MRRARLLASPRRMRWAEAHEKIARMTLTIKLDRNWSSFQLANSAPPLSVTDSAIAPSARMDRFALRLLSCSWQVAPRCLETRSRQRDARRSDDATNQGSRKTSKVTPKGVLPPTLCHASATRESAGASSQQELSPQKNSCDKQVSSWRHISCHTDKNRYYT